MSFTLKDSQNVDTGLDRVGVAGQTKRGSSFTAGSGYDLTLLEFLIGKENGPVGNVHSALYSFDGVNLPSALIATSSTSVDASTLSTVPAYVAFAFAPQTLVSGAKYYGVLYGDGAGDGFGSGNLIWERNAGTVTGQNLVVFESGSWFEHRANNQHDFNTYADATASSVAAIQNFLRQMRS